MKEQKKAKIRNSGGSTLSRCNVRFFYKYIVAAEKYVGDNQPIFARKGEELRGGSDIWLMEPTTSE